jgi:tyrosyl-tRNA synthetase
VHGLEELARAELASAVLFGGELEGLDARDIADIFADVPSSEMPSAALRNGGTLVVDLVAQSSLAGSRGEAKRDVQGGGIYLNNRRIEEIGQAVTMADAIDGQFLVLRKGKKRYHLIRVIN